MKTSLRNTDVNSAFSVVEQFMTQNLRWAKVPVTSLGANVSFVVAHGLGVEPDFVVGTPLVAGNSIGVTEAEQNAWNERFITVHSSASLAKYNLLIGTFN